MSSHVVVLMGGWSAEREVSLVSGAAVANALSNAGYQVTSIDVQRDMSSLLTRLSQAGRRFSTHYMADMAKMAAFRVS